MMLELFASLLGRRWLVIGALIAVAAAGLAIAGYGLHKYNQGVADDKSRSDAVIEGMVRDADRRVAEADARTAAREAYWQHRLEEVQHAADQERDLNRRRLAAERAAAGQLRDQLAAYAAGGLQAGDDSLAACRERASALGESVAGVLLPALARCAGKAEDLATDARQLLGAWPVADKPVGD